MTGPYRDVKFAPDPGLRPETTVLDNDPPLVFGDDPLTPTEQDFWTRVYVALIAIPVESGPGAARGADKAVLRLRRRVALGAR